MLLWKEIKLDGSVAQISNKVVVILSMDIKVFVGNKIVNAAHYLGLLKGLMHRRHCNRKRTFWLLDDNARPSRHGSTSPRTE